LSVGDDRTKYIFVHTHEARIGWKPLGTLLRKDANEAGKTRQVKQTPTESLVEALAKKSDLIPVKVADI